MCYHFWACCPCPFVAFCNQIVQALNRSKPALTIRAWRETQSKHWGSKPGKNCAPHPIQCSCYFIESPRFSSEPFQLNETDSSMRSVIPVHCKLRPRSIRPAPLKKKKTENPQIQAPFCHVSRNTVLLKPYIFMYYFYVSFLFSSLLSW